MKKLLSMIIALIVAITSLYPCQAVFAGEYENYLINSGFPSQYISKLSELHRLHPNWIFKPLVTNLDWYTAVNGERLPHTKQLIEKCSLYKNTMYCDCPSCCVNGNYLVREGKNWVSASQTAVEYYMNPVNWLDEKHIFQFESTAYDGTQTKEGVEAILQGTWMYDSLITYRTTSGSVKQYDTVTKYSDAIMAAARDASISAYYLAAKIRQENGGAQASATAVNGSTSPFQGVYNYFNIGAYSGAMDGLAWAAGFLKLNKDSVLYSYNPDTATDEEKAAGTVIPITKGQYMTWRADYNGNYYKVRLYAEINGSYVEGATGYVLKTDCRNDYISDTASGWGRPWTNPYKAIYYGAKYIAKSFGTQNTNYLQKFNVNPASSSLYTNEYMRNVAGASSEAVSTYNGYNSAGILDITKTFVIPVFNGMPESIDVTGATVVDFGTDSVALSWNPLSTADGYEIEINDNGVWRYCVTVGTTYAYISSLAPSGDYTFRVRAFRYDGADVSFGLYSNEVQAYTKPVAMQAPAATSTSNSVTLKWTPQNKASGYSVYIYKSANNKYVYYKDVAGGSTSSVTLSGLSADKNYKFKILAYKNINGVKYKGTRSSAVSITTKKKNQVQLSSLKSSKAKKLTVKWKKLSGVTGYEVMWSTSSNFKSNFLSVKVKDASAVTKTLTTSRSNKKYYVRVRAYKTSNGKTKYYPWSSTKSIKVK